MWPLIAAGAAALAGAIIKGVSNKRAQRRQNAYNKQMAELENQKQLEYWNMQNEYNSPAAQMQRLKDAGLNPNLAYQSVSTGNAEAMPSYSTPEQSFQNYAGEAMQEVGSTLASQITAYQSIQMNQAQIEAQRMNNELLRAHMPYANSAAYLKYHGQEVQNLLTESQIDKVNEEINYINSNRELNQQQRQNLERNFELLGKQLENMDVQKRISLIDESIRAAQKSIIEDTNEYAREFIRVQGRLMKANSLEDIDIADALKFVIFGLFNGHFHVPFQ